MQRSYYHHTSAVDRRAATVSYVASGDIRVAADEPDGDIRNRGVGRGREWCAKCDGPTRPRPTLRVVGSGALMYASRQGLCGAEYTGGPLRCWCAAHFERGLACLFGENARSLSIVCVLVLRESFRPVCSGLSLHEDGLHIAL